LDFEAINNFARWSRVSYNGERNSGMVPTRVTEGERVRKPSVDTSAIVNKENRGLTPPLANRSVLPAFDAIGTRPEFHPHSCRKYKVVPIMPSQQLPRELFQEIRQLAANWGRIVSRRTFGDDGPGIDTDFDNVEQLTELRGALPLYPLVDQERDGVPRRLIVYRRGTRKYVRLRADRQGRLLLAPLRLLVGLRDERVVCWDADTGEELGDVEAMDQARRRAEVIGEAEALARRAAEAALAEAQVCIRELESQTRHKLGKRSPRGGNRT
jgi:hypothetical protein